MDSTLQKIQDSKLYKTDNIGIATVTILEERRLLKQAQLSKKTIKQLNDYVFGDAENPFQNIQDLYEKKNKELQQRMDKILSI